MYVFYNPSEPLFAAHLPLHRGGLDAAEDPKYQSNLQFMLFHSTISLLRPEKERKI